MNKRIYVTGASGTGKTTLCKGVDSVTKSEIPFISTSAKKIWPAFGLKTYQNVIDLITDEPNLGFKYQKCILNNRVKSLIDNDNFITDRSPIDNLAYIYLQLSDKIEPKLIEELINSQVIPSLRLATHLVYIPWNERVLNCGYDDNVRLKNYKYQELVDMVIYSLIINPKYTMYIKVLRLEDWGIATRLNKVMEWLKD